MGQQDIYQYLLAKEGKWLTSKEISDEIGIGRGSIQCSLRKLLKQNEIMVKKGRGSQHWYTAKT